MALLKSLLLASLSLGLTWAHYEHHPNPTPRGKTCVIPSKYAPSNSTADDSAAISSAFEKCAKNSKIVFSEGVDYNVFYPISATDLSNVEIQMRGNLHLPQNITYIQAIFNQTTNATYTTALYWFKFAGPNIDYLGTDNVTDGWIYSYGQAWWNANIYPAAGLVSRPHLMNFNTTNGSIRHFKSRKPIAWGCQLSGNNIDISDTVIDAYSTTGSFPFNTDGFDVGATNVRITNSMIFNGDDAIAVQSGAHNVLFQGGTIGYQTHGMSIGSLGQDQTAFANVTNIHFDDITVINGVYGARFKSWKGGQGIAKNITWSNIRTYNVTFPIFVTQSYINQGGSQTQLQNGATAARPNNSSVIMQDFTWSDFTGTINTFSPGDGSCVTDPCWYNVGLPNLQHTEAVIIECNTNVSCSNFELQNIQVFPQTLAASTAVCINATSTLNPKLGFPCANGTFVPT
jgi:polygalacturonase